MAEAKTELQGIVDARQKLEAQEQENKSVQEVLETFPACSGGL